MKLILTICLVLFQTFQSFGQQGIDYSTMINDDEVKLMNHSNSHYDFAELAGGNDVFRWTKKSYDGKYYEEVFFTILERCSKKGLYTFILEDWDDKIVRVFKFYTSPKFVTIEEEGVQTIVITGDFVFH